MGLGSRQNCSGDKRGLIRILQCGTILLGLSYIHLALEPTGEPWQPGGYSNIHCIVLKAWENVGVNSILRKKILSSVAACRPEFASKWNGLLSEWDRVELFTHSLENAYNWVNAFTVTPERSNEELTFYKWLQLLLAICYLPVSVLRSQGGKQVVLSQPATS